MNPDRSHAAGDGHNRKPVDWEAALAAHRPWLCRVIASRLGEPQAVDDVFQEVALAAVEQKSPLADPARVAPWLYRLAVVKALRHRRTRGRQRRRDRQAAERTTTGDSGGEIPFAWLLRKERRELVRAALEQMRPRDAEILMLKYFENWSYRRLAHRLGIGEKAVDARLDRARRRLRTLLADFIDEGEA